MSGLVKRRLPMLSPVGTSHGLEEGSVSRKMALGLQSRSIRLSEIGNLSDVGKR